MSKTWPLKINQLRISSSACARRGRTYQIGGSRPSTRDRWQTKRHGRFAHHSFVSGAGEGRRVGARHGQRLAVGRRRAGARARGMANGWRWGVRLCLAIHDRGGGVAGYLRWLMASLRRPLRKSSSVHFCRSLMLLRHRERSPSESWASWAVLQSLSIAVA